MTIFLINFLILLGIILNYKEIIRVMLRTRLNRLNCKASLLKDDIISYNFCLLWLAQLLSAISLLIE